MSLCALDGDERGAKALLARKILVTRRLIDASLEAQVGVQRLDRQAVRLDRTIAAPFAHRSIDEHAPVRVGKAAGLAAAALFGRADLIVDEHGHARLFA